MGKYTLKAFKRVTWYLANGDDWDFREDYLVTDNLTMMYEIKEVPTGVEPQRTLEVNVCRGELDVTPDLIKIKERFPGFYKALIAKYGEPDRMKAIKNTESEL